MTPRCPVNQGDCAYGCLATGGCTVAAKLGEIASPIAVIDRPSVPEKSIQDMTLADYRRGIENMSRKKWAAV